MRSMVLRHFPLLNDERRRLVSSVGTIGGQGYVFKVLRTVPLFSTVEGQQAQETYFILVLF